MSRNLSFALCFIQILIFVHATGKYSIVGPGTIRSNTKYNVAVSLHKAEGPCDIEVGITGPSFNATKSVHVAPMSTENVEFDVPKLKDGDYNLTAKGISGIEFQNSTKLNYADFKPSTFIQTDKATYKPGDLVQFLIMFLDRNARPAKIDKSITVVINDGAQNRIKQIKDVKLIQGIYTGSFQLSEQPVLGNWNIEVDVEGKSADPKNFEVAKYVLPPFQVIIDTAKDVVIADGIIKVTVRAKYTSGKPVKGKATVSIMPYYNFYGIPNNKLEAQKTIDVDGKGYVEFTLNEDLRLSTKLSYVPTLAIFADMEEKLTGNKNNATATVKFHSQRYRIEFIKTPYNYSPSKWVIFKVAVKNLDGSPVQDTKNLAKLIVEPSRNNFSRGFVYDGSITPQPEQPVPLIFGSNLNKHGRATFNVKLPSANHSSYSVTCEFLDTTTVLSSLSNYSETEESYKPLKLTVKTQKPQLGKDVSFKVKSNKILKNFVYTVTARGNILKTEQVEVPENRKSHTITITPTFEMIPRATVFVYYVQDNNLRFAEQTITFEKQFENSIDISAPVQAKPSEDVQLKITTDPDSFVVLLGVDQSVSPGFDFNKDDIFNSLSNYNTYTPWNLQHERYPGLESGLVTMTNANYPYKDDPDDDDSVHNVPVIDYVKPGPISKKVKALGVRKEFPEAWIWHTSASSDKDGLTLSKKIPDTITSWVITAFSLNPKTGFALTENPTKIQVFKPFVVSTNLPYSVKLGEVIAIPVTIFNFMDKEIDAAVKMNNYDGEFRLLNSEDDTNPTEYDYTKKFFTIYSNTTVGVSFLIIPKNVGITTLKIDVITPEARERMQHQLKVEPEGMTQYQNRAQFINLKNNADSKDTVEGSLKVDIPTNAVPDSEYIEFSVVGDLLGPTIKNIDKLVLMPYGCGEQNMVNFVPNILVLRYLEAINQNMPTITEKAKKFLEIGYQREFTYKHKDGSYSAFGESDGTGSTWLTAYVARSFQQAAKYTDIDPKVIMEALDFLDSKQAENGSFPEDGKLFDNTHQNLLGLTASVVLAFLENVENTKQYESVIAKGIQYLTENIDKTDDQYSLSIAAVALQQAKNPLGDKVLERLQTLAKNENDRRWWSQTEEKPTTDQPSWYWRPRSNDVEITSYVLLALLEKQGPETVLPIIKWLISQRNSNGGFSSTQDTVMGLQALTKFAEKAGSGSGDMNIDFVASGSTDGDKGTIRVNPENALLLQTHVLPKSTRQVNFTASGKGSAMVQLSYRFNLADKEPKPHFKINTNVRTDTPSKQLIVDVCAEYLQLNENDKKDSNMAVIEISLPSGYTADIESFDKIEAVDRVKRTETKNSDSTVIVYFDSLTAGDVKCIPIEATKTHDVAKLKPAPVVIYDYYNTEDKANNFYDVYSSMCDICQGTDCGKGCKKE